MSSPELSLVRRAASTVDTELDLMLALSEHVIAELSLDELLRRLCTCTFAAELIVEDDGVGIEAELMPRLFEPLLTTKGAGPGTGLGLATCYGIIRQLGGAIRVSSELGRGTCFELLFPRAHTSTVRAVETPPQGQELAAKTIWVDDDDAVRSTVCAVLTRLGHEVRSSTDGAAALAELTTTDLAVDLLITAAWRSCSCLATRPSITRISSSSAATSCASPPRPRSSRSSCCASSRRAPARTASMA